MASLSMPVLTREYHDSGLMSWYCLNVIASKTFHSFKTSRASTSVQASPAFAKYPFNNPAPFSSN